ADPRYAEAARQAKAVRAEQDRAAERRAKNFQDVRTRWSQPRQWNVPLTLALIGISIVVAVLTRLGGDRHNHYEDALRIAGVSQYVSASDGEEVPLPTTLRDSVVRRHE